jgi:hypothetical protein
MSSIFLPVLGCDRSAKIDGWTSFGATESAILATFGLRGF